MLLFEKNILNGLGIYIYVYICVCVCVCVYLFIWIGKKQRDYAFIPTSLFRDYSLIRGFFVKNIHDHFMSWRMLALRSPYNSAIIRCNPCLKEKLFIIRQPELSSLNKRNEFVSSCRHRKKALLRTIIQSIEIYRHAHYANL